MTHPLLVFVFLLPLTLCLEWYQQGDPVLIGSDNLTSLTQQPRTYKFVKLFTPHCRYCRVLKVIVDNQVKPELVDRPDIKFYEINCHVEQNICFEYQAFAFPVALMLGVDGEIRDRLVGARPKDMVIDFIRRNANPEFKQQEEKKQEEKKEEQKLEVKKEEQEQHKAQQVIAQDKKTHEEQKPQQHKEETPSNNPHEAEKKVEEAHRTEEDKEQHKQEQHKNNPQPVPQIKQENQKPAEQHKNEQKHPQHPQNQVNHTDHTIKKPAENQNETSNQQRPSQHEPVHSEEKKEQVKAPEQKPGVRPQQQPVKPEQKKPQYAGSKQQTKTPDQQQPILDPAKTHDAQKIDQQIIKQTRSLQNHVADDHLSSSGDLSKAHILIFICIGAVIGYFLHDILHRDHSRQARLI